MSLQYRCALAPFRVQGDAAPVHLFHLPLSIPGARLFGFLAGGESAEALRVLSIIQERAAAAEAKSGETIEAFAGSFFKLTNRAIRDLPLKCYALKKPPVVSALAAITHGSQIALSGRRALAFRLANAAQSPTDLLSPEQPADPKTLFPTLVFGGLGKRDALLLATRSLLDYCAPAHLGRLMNAASAEATREAVITVLQSLQPSVTVVGVAIKLVPTEQHLFEPESPTTSLNTLLRQARETEALLTPTFLPSLTRFFGRLRTGMSLRGGMRPLRISNARSVSLLRRIMPTLRSLPARLLAFPARTREEASRFKTLPRALQLRIMATALGGLVLAVGSVALVWRIALSREQIRAEGILATVSAKRAALEASVLYGDENTAWSRLAEAREAAATLPDRFRSLRTQKKDTLSALDADVRRLRHEVFIDTPAKADHDPFKDGSLPPTESVYNNRRYRLDSAAAMIFRHARAGSAWDAGSPWLAAPDPALKDGRAIAVDGAVYVGATEGAILKYHKGKAQPFALGRIDPPLGEIVSLRAPEDSPYLYLLIPGTTRVVVLNRNQGSVAAQYSSPSFSAAIDLLVDEIKRVMYIKTAAATYSVPAAHIK